MTFLKQGLVLGASSGIGEATLGVLQRGLPKVQWWAPSKEVLDLRYAGDVWNYFRERHEAGLPGFEYIVYSAGINSLAHIGKPHGPYSPEEIAEVNYLGFIRVLDAHRGIFPNAVASIVAVGSDAAERPLRTSIAYCSSKAALHMAVRVAARELGPLGFRVNAVAPGMTDETGMQAYVDAAVPKVRGWTPEEARDYERSQEVVPGRINKLEVAEVIYQTLTGPAHLNGSIITLNGGR